MSFVSTSGSESDAEAGALDCRARLVVKRSRIPGAGDGLFWKGATRARKDAGCFRLEKGTIVLQEEARVIGSKAVKRIFEEKEWQDAYPVIEYNKGVSLDIRGTLLYKLNHAESSSKQCNTTMKRCGHGTLKVIAKRHIYEDEELCWCYSDNWLAGKSQSCH